MAHFNPADTSPVLILDDQATSRTILAQVVRSIGSGIKVQEESSPSSALVWAATHTAGLVLVDYLMPDMNGIDFICLLRQVTGYQHVPVIMITINCALPQSSDPAATTVDSGRQKPVAGDLG